MGKRLVIAEKPMLAKAILDAIPGTAKSIKAGERVFYTEKGDYLVVALLVFFFLGFDKLSKVGTI